MANEPRVPRFAVLVLFLITLQRLSVHDEQFVVPTVIAVFMLSLWSITRQNSSVVSKRILTNDLEVISKYNLQLLLQLGELDMQTRQDLGTWLHSAVQPKLLKIARTAWSIDSVETQAIAAEIDLLNDEVVRGYSHQLFPVQLHIALILALADLLLDRAEFSYDDRMLPAINELTERKSLSDLDAGSIGLKNNQVFFPIKQRFAIYRIVEEAVANAEKKPSTTKIRVDISIPKDQIIITVIDNGAPIANTVEPGLGSRLIDTYSLLHKGSWNLSNISEGVEFRCVFPVATEFIG
jgi:glucose-6-phosphate-specific signal transduction histidine kinase